MNKVLKGARIIDCVSDEPIEGGHLVIKNDQIESINRETSGLEVSEEIDLSGKTILPGLINMHVHLTGDDNEDLMPDMLRKTEEELLLQAVRASRSALNSGVTTLRDCGSKNNLVHWLRDAIHSGKLAGPRIISSGMPITITGGHCFYLGREADGVGEVRKAVRSLVKEGSDFIKVMATGGGCTPHTDKTAPSYTDEELYAIVEEAHSHGRAVAAHAHGTRGIRQTVEAGVDTIEHCSFLTENGMKAETEILELIKENNIAIVPTVSGNIRLVYEGSFNKEFFDQSATDMVDHFHQRFDLFREFLESGVNFVLGNDAGTQGTPHDDFVCELEVMAELGMENDKVIEFATKKASQVLGLADEIGTIQEGKKADLLVVNDNPLQNIETLRNPYMVISGGEVVN